MLIVAVYAYSRLSTQEKEIKSLKKEFGQILDIVEPIVKAEPQPPVEEVYEDEVQEPQQQTMRQPMQRQMQPPTQGQMQRRMPPPAVQQQAMPYGARVRQKESREQPPLNPSSSGAVTVPGVPSEGGVTLEALAGAHEYAGLF